jgi:predicted dehydrogenase
MSALRFVVIDPGHFHGALLQAEMYDNVAAEVQVYAPFGPDLLDYLTRIGRFNRRAERPTRWALEVHASQDFLERMTRERTETVGTNVAIIAGRNRNKIALIEAALGAGMHVLADKPWIIRPADRPRLQAALELARRRGLVAYDIMTGRFEITAILLGALCRDDAVFGEPVAGTPAEPGVAITSVHHLLKQVAGVPNPRPAWYFDVHEQGEALADIGTHLVDLTHRTLFPDTALDPRADIRLTAARRWSTPVSLAQFRQVTGEACWPDALEAAVKGDVLDYATNGRLDYAVRGVHVRLEAVWNWQAPPGGNDTHHAVFRGSRARLELRQGATEGERRDLVVVPEADIGAALERRIAALQADYPGVGLERRGAEWSVTIPDRYRVGHEANFLELGQRFLGYVARPDSMPAWETPTMLTKYFVTTEAVALADQTAARA